MRRWPFLNEKRNVNMCYFKTVMSGCHSGKTDMTPMLSCWEDIIMSRLSCWEREIMHGLLLWEEQT